jgi:hypothetical protein
MRQQIVSLSVHQTARVLAVMYALMGLILLPILLVATMVGEDGPGIGLGLALFLPVLYGIFGYIFVAIGCWLYNLVASRLGGIELEVRTESGDTLA